MKKVKLFCTAILLGCGVLSTAQVVQQTPEIPNDGFRISVRGGYDFPNYTIDAITTGRVATVDSKTSAEYIDHEGGWMAGLSLDYYWNWFGIGADFDYINNKPKSTYPTNLYDWNQQPITDFQLKEEKIARMFYGIGPSFRFMMSPKSDFEFKLRAGMASIKGGEVLLAANAGKPVISIPLNSHSGYNLENVFSGKASLQYNYFFSKNVGFHLGAYYINHFKTMEKEVSGVGYGFQIPHLQDGGRYLIYDDAFATRSAIDSKINSFGAFAGLTFVFNKPEKPAPVPCTITVNAKEEVSGNVLANAAVQLIDSNGAVVKNGVTNAMGSVKFSDVENGNYSVRGTYNQKSLTSNTISSSDFNNCERNGGIEKEIILPDNRFTVSGSVVRCNTSEGIPGAVVVVKNNATGKIDNYESDVNGRFTFRAPENASYTVYAKKANFISQTVNFSTAGYNLQSNPTLQLEICMDKADCNESVVLKNILYDLDKSFIREDAKPELNRLVQFMTDNPTADVELSSHTDSRGSNVYNEKLSQRRAQAAVDYIVSQGISKSRLTAKGYGERILLNKCADGVKCTEAEHQLNRRTEMKVICPTK